LNLHALRRRNLNPLRLPVSPHPQPPYRPGCEHLSDVPGSVKGRNRAEALGRNGRIRPFLLHAPGRSRFGL